MTESPMHEHSSALRKLRLLEEIGSGSTGTVHRGVLLEAIWGAPAGTEIAVKFLHQQLTGDPVARSRFLHEARAGMAVSHPVHQHLVRILAVCEENLLGQDLLFLVMNYVPGPTLRQWLKEGQPGNEPLVREIGLQLAQALSSLHCRGVVHLDLKPENVILSREDQAVLMDLGFAREFAPTTAGPQIAPPIEPRSSSQPFAGSLAYAAPELLRGALPTPLCDLYSLGVLLFELLHGTLPFAAREPEAIISEKLASGPLPAASRNSSLASSFLAAVLDTLLAPRPRDRFSSAAQVASILEQGERSTWWSTSHQAAREVRTRSLHALPLCGRETELAELLHAFQRARAGERSLLRLGGELNMGTGRLLVEFEHRLSHLSEPTQILEGRCPPRNRSLPYGGIISILEHFLGLARGARPRPAEIARLSEFCGTKSARLLGSALSGEEGPRSALTLPQAFCNFTAGLAQRTPLLMILEDFHHAFGPTLQTIELLLEEERGAPLLPIVTLRPSRVPENPELVDLLKRLERRDRCSSITLKALDRSAVHSLISRVFATDVATEDFADALFERTGGAPGFIVAVLEMLLGNGAIQWREGRLAPRRDIAEIPIPQSMAEAILQRREELGAELRTELERAAVTGRRFDADLLAEAFGGSALEHAHLLGRLEIGQDILTPHGQAFEFVSSGTRDVLLSSQPVASRRQAHLRVADALERRAASEGAGRRLLLEIAHHAGCGGDHERALHYLLPLARDLLEFGTATRAAELSREALEHLQNLPENDEHLRQRLELLLIHADASGRIGERAAERESAEKALRIATEHSRERERITALIYLGRHAHRTSKNELALGYLDRALHLTEAIEDSELQAFTRVGMGTALGFLGRYREAQLQLAQARRLAGTIPSRMEVIVIVAQARNMLDQGYPSQALELLGEALQRMKNHPDRNQQLRAYFQSSRALATIGAHSRALARVEQALEIEREIADRHMRANLLSLAGDLQMRLGRFEQALTTLEDALVLSTHIGDRYTSLHTWIHKANAYLSAPCRDADPRKALRCARHAMRLAEDLDNPRHLAAALAILAAVRLQLGRVEEALQASERALRIHRGCQRDTQRRIAILFTHFTILHRRGDPAAQRYLTRCLRLRRAKALRLQESDRQSYLEGDRLSLLIRAAALAMGLDATLDEQRSSST